MASEVSCSSLRKAEKDVVNLRRVLNDNLEILTYKGVNSDYSTASRGAPISLNVLLMAEGLQNCL